MRSVESGYLLPADCFYTMLSGLVLWLVCGPWLPTTVVASCVPQATGTLAVNFLLRTLGSQPSPSVSSIGGFSSSGSATGSIPGDTLHLVLEYMQQRLPTCNASAQWSAKDSGRNCSAMAQISQEAAGSPVPSGSGYCRHLNLNTSAALDKPSILSPAGRLNSNRVRSLAGISEGSPTCSERSTAGTAIEQEEAKQASTYRRHCFELFTALVELEARHVPAGMAESAADYPT